MWNLHSLISASNIVSLNIELEKPIAAAQNLILSETKIRQVLVKGPLTDKTCL